MRFTAQFIIVARSRKETKLANNIGIPTGSISYREKLWCPMDYCQYYYFKKLLTLLALVDSIFIHLFHFENGISTQSVFDQLNVVRKFI